MIATVHLFLPATSQNSDFSPVPPQEYFHARISKCFKYNMDITEWLKEETKVTEQKRRNREDSSCSAAISVTSRSVFYSQNEKAAAT